MLVWVIKVSFLSFLLIFLIHYLYSFFLQNLTTPKVKDFVNRPSEQYEKMMSSLNTEKTETVNVVHTKSNDNNDNNDSSLMKDELKRFLTKEMDKSNEPSYSNIDVALPGGSSNLVYSNFSRTS